MNQLASLINRVLFGASFVLVALAVSEKFANYSGYTVLGSMYEPSRLLEFAAVALLFVFALLLRDIHHAVVSKHRT